MTSRCPKFPIRAALVGLAASAMTAAGAAPPSAVMPDKYFEFFDRYCLDCHDSATEKGSVNLENLSFDLGTIPSAELWQKVLNTINSGEMPPEDKKQPSAEDKTEFLDTLSHTLVNARDLLTDSGGLITMRRLNRREYENTMRHLLDVDVDAENLPDDVNSDGFDTAGASLFFSSDQFEQYLTVARRALEDAINTGPKPETKRVRLQAEVEGNRRVQNFYDNLLDSHNRAEAWRKSNKPPTAFGFIDKDRVAFEDGNYKKWWPGTDRYLKDPLSKKGALLYTWFQGAQTARADVPSKSPPGKYILRARVGAIGDQPSHRRFLELGHPASGGRTGELSLIDCQRVTGTTEDPQILEFPVTISRSGERQFAFRERGPNTRDAARYAFVTGSREDDAGPEPALWIDWIEWEGPFVEKWPPTSHRKIFFKGPDAQKTDGYAREVISRFARRAFRITNPSPSFVDKLVRLYQIERQNGKSFEQALVEPLAVILASPSFLYLNEPAPDDEKRALTDLELAVRLSYFLWSAPPDAELYDLARQGKLKSPAVLKRQTNRMLDDPRASNFISGFAHQWLHMERLDFFQFNYRHFWEFDESVKHAARDEIYETLRVLINKNLPVGRLLKSDFVVINDLLADYYGIEGIGGSRFRKVELDEDSPRGGLLGTAAVLAMGSDGERSSPVERGAWVMRKILNDPPPPAPANVPQLSRLTDDLLPARKLISAHMEEAQCAQCHRKIDPIGYGLENFDAAGRWREQELVEVASRDRVEKSKKYAIDPTGTLPDGTEFADFFELRDQIAAREPDFARGFTEALIEYGLGRPYGFTDQDLADQILAQAEKQDNRIRSFITALVLSKPFQTK